MMEAQITEFPFVAELPKREKSKIIKVWEQFREIAKAQEEHGALIPPTLAASALGISRQRVHELCEFGTLQVIRVSGHPLVTEHSIVDFAKSERKAGRPPKAPSNSELWKACRESAKEAVKSSK